jgi:hypothetical protein
MQIVSVARVGEQGDTAVLLSGVARLFVDCMLMMWLAAVQHDCLACVHGRQEQYHMRLHAEQEGEWYMLLSTLLQATVRSVTGAIHEVVSRSCLHGMTPVGDVAGLLGCWVAGQ